MTVKMVDFGLLAFLVSMINLAIVIYVGYYLQKKKYDIGKIVEKKIGNVIKSSLGVKGNELNTAVRRVDKDVRSIMNTHVEDLEEFLPGAAEYLEKGRTDLAVGGILGFLLKLMPLFISQSPNLPGGAKTAATIASQINVDKIISFINKIRKRPKKPKAEKKAKDEDNVTVPRSFT